MLPTDHHELRNPYGVKKKPHYSTILLLSLVFCLFGNTVEAQSIHSFSQGDITAYANVKLDLQAYQPAVDTAALSAIGLDPSITRDAFRQELQLTPAQTAALQRLHDSEATQRQLAITQACRKHQIPLTTYQAIQKRWDRDPKFQNTIYPTIITEAKKR